MPVLLGGLIAASGPSGASGAPPDGHHGDTPLAKAPARMYPSGASLREDVSTPNQMVNFAPGLAPAGAAPEMMTSAAMAERAGARVVGARAATGRFQLAPLYSTRVGVIAEPPAAEGMPQLAPAAAPAHAEAAASAEANGQGPSKYVVSYELLYKGIPLAKPTSATTLFGPDGQVLLVRERNLPGEGEIATEPTVSRDAAVNAGREALKQAEPNAEVSASPATLEVWVDGDRKAHLTWAFVLATPPQPRGAVARKYWVAARGEPKALHAEDLIYNAGADEPRQAATAAPPAAEAQEDASATLPIFHGKVTGTIWPPLKSPLTSPAGQPGFPLPFLTVRRNGAVVATTNALGNYSFLGFGHTAISANLSGLYCVVDNKAGGEMSRIKQASAGSTTNLVFNASGELELAQVSAYYWTNVARQFAAKVLQPLPAGPARLDKLPTNVNIDDECNAFWNGSSLNFFKSGHCPNTAYGDVVMHEYGHGVDSALGGIVDGAYSEGFGDSLAILALRDPIIGRDFFGPGQNLRDARNVVTWPPSNPEVHFAGQIYAGFVWELTQQLLHKYGNQNKAFAVAKDLVLGSAALNPSSIPDAVAQCFKVDDDDNNPSNGTPHAAEIKAAAASRHIPVPSPF